MTTNKTMTKGEIETLKTILALGGLVYVSMGRKHSRAHVRTSTMNSLAKRGYVRLWASRTDSGLPVMIRPGGAWADYMVTAAGCVALAEVSQ